MAGAENFALAARDYRESVTQVRWSGPLDAGGHMTREEIENCWKDPHNRKWGLFYYCKADPRVIVPRRFKWMGWTVNAARPSAIPVLLVLFAILACPVFIASANGAGKGLLIITEAVAIAVVCLICAFLSSRTG
jgi:hypothetical protein